MWRFSLAEDLRSMGFSCDPLKDLSFPLIRNLINIFKMRSFQIVEYKLRESEFFLNKIEALSFDLAAAQFYLSAFLSAARSVTFALQASLNGLKGFDDWYGVEQAKLQKNILARYFVVARNLSQKIGFYPIGSFHRHKDRKGNLKTKWYFSQIYPESQKIKIPQIDIVLACKKYLIQMLKILRECYKKFGVHIDTNKRYTKEGLKELNMRVEDVELENGFPSGWTEGLSKEDRIRIFREIFYNPSTDDIFFKYLKTDRYGEKVGNS